MFFRTSFRLDELLLDSLIVNTSYGYLVIRAFNIVGVE